MNTCEWCHTEFEPAVGHPDQKYHADSCRRQAQNARRREPPPPDTGPTPDELVKAKELKSIEKRVRDEVGRTHILCDLLEGAVERVNESDLRPYRPKLKTKRDPETMVVLRSDLHPGLVTPSYNLEVFHKRMDLFAEKVILIHDIISKTIPLEKLVILDLGDLVSGQGIFPNQAWKSQEHVLKQIYQEAAPDIIRQNMSWAEYFPVVEDHLVPGNHGRTGKEYPDEVNFDNILAQDIWRRFEFVDRMDIQPEWGKFKMVDVYSWRFLCTHGSLVRSWMNIPFYGLVNKGMRWQGSMPNGPWHYLAHGHFHTDFLFPWNNFVIIGNGTLVSDDDFALEQLGMASRPAQQVFGVHPEHGITWRYTLKLD